ncbi:hypothetical protein [Nostoc sp. 106C]|uniref:hypothetical protein n=1 Tax=Nostoc sp. 106C TaxID=1932667 RepID=UPI000A3ABE47|nr:hypothetical protein [Nostoc sp. 106C]OUL24907.1 hypothetical protein BV375_23720 [Nostoc sp. 106C]
MTRTFIDSGVLIAAARANTIRSLAALEILNDGDRFFTSSAFIQLETLPNTFHFNNEMIQICW